MAKFKKGDIVTVIEQHDHIQPGDTGTVVENDSDNPYIEWDKFNEDNYEWCGYGSIWCVGEDFLELYETRYIVDEPQYEIY